MISYLEACTRVARGAAHLDVVRPGWWQQIDVGLLEIGSCERCVAAQLATGEYDYPFTGGLQELGLGRNDRHGTLVADHGMGLKAGDYERDGIGHEDVCCFALLQDAWIAAIADRRFAHEAPVTRAVERERTTA